MATRLRWASLGALALAACAGSGSSPSGAPSPSPRLVTNAPNPDPRVGLKPGLFDAGEAIWNLRLVSATQPPERFARSTNSDLAFSGKYAIQGNYNGFQVWDLSDPAKPALTKEYYCPASQSDVSVYRHLLFVSGEGTGGRLDCGGQGVREPVSHDRLRGIRIFDITDITNPKYVGNVQTCRGSHTHSVLAHPGDTENVYVYVSGSAPVRPADEMPGCLTGSSYANTSTAEFRIEVIKVPLANPERAAIVSSPRIFQDLAAPPRHGPAPEDVAAQKKAEAEAKARGAFVVDFQGQQIILPDGFARQMLDSVVKARGGAGAAAATGADSAALRTALPDLLARMFGGRPARDTTPRPGVTQCHDITLFPGIGMAGGACEGYGLLLDIRDPINPKRIAEVADSNFSYWHSATFNNDGTKILFTDEWGGGGAPKCRATDKPEWGADAIFTIENGKMVFQSYYKLPAAQTWEENCVAHNGSLIPIPGRDVMVQGWYQGGISVFDWTDPKHPVEIAFHDRGPLDGTRMQMAGSWSVYWYNGVIVSSEIRRGLDVFELTTSPMLSQNEIDAAKTVKWEYLNAQGQPKFVWPPSFALARAYVDQLERSSGMAASRIATVRQSLTSAEGSPGTRRRDALNQLAAQLDGEAAGPAAGKIRTLSRAVRELAAASR